MEVLPGCKCEGQSFGLRLLRFDKKPLILQLRRHELPEIVPIRTGPITMAPMAFSDKLICARHWEIVGDRLRLHSGGILTESAFTEVKDLIEFSCGNFPFPGIDVDISNSGLTEGGLKLICDHFVRLQSNRCMWVRRIDATGLHLTDESIPRFIYLCRAHEGYIREINLSDNVITNEGARSLIISVHGLYPFKGHGKKFPLLLGFKGNVLTFPLQEVPQGLYRTVLDKQTYMSRNYYCTSPILIVWCDEVDTNNRLTLGSSVGRNIAIIDDHLMGGKLLYILAISYLGHTFRGFQLPSDFDKADEFVQGNLAVAVAKVTGTWDPKNLDSALSESALWRVSSRTDAGVHAVSVLVQMSLPFVDDVSKFIDSMNCALEDLVADNVRVLSMCEAGWLVNKDSTSAADRSHNYCPAIRSQRLCAGRTYEYALSAFALAPLVSDNFSGPDSWNNLSSELRSRMWRSRAKPKDIEGFNKILAGFLGTHDFARFTTEKSRNAGSTMRHIDEISVSRTLVAKDGIEFAIVVIRGDRFLYHQIRHMLGLAILCVHVLPSLTQPPKKAAPQGTEGNQSNNAQGDTTTTPSSPETSASSGTATVWTIAAALTPRPLPLAPGEPLLLRRYNARSPPPAGWNQAHRYSPTLRAGMLKLQAWLEDGVEPAAARWAKEKIYPHVASKKTAETLVTFLQDMLGCGGPVRRLQGVASKDSLRAVGRALEQGVTDSPWAAT